MFPPGRGNDNLDPGDIYLISVFGTNEMITAVGEDLCLREVNIRKVTMTKCGSAKRTQAIELACAINTPGVSWGDG